MKKLWDGLPDNHDAFEELLLNPKNISDKAWVEGGKLNQLLIDIEQALVTTDLSPADAVKQLREEGGKLDLTIIE
jgi:hypothetical protein